MNDDDTRLIAMGLRRCVVVFCIALAAYSWAAWFTHSHTSKFQDRIERAP